jgi:tetrahydromethanopterin S-methyltransferase subunit F
MTVESVSTNTQSTGTNGLAVASLVTGLLSVVFCWGGWVFVATAAVAVFTGIRGNRSVKSQHGVATAGVVLGVIAAVLEFVILCSIGRP